LVVTIDYAYVKTNEGREKEEEGAPTLVLTCRETKWAGSFVVPNKTENNYAIERLSQEINLLGHKRLILKPDQEQGEEGEGGGYDTGGRASEQWRNRKGS
jgi:hypothetical protein